MNRRVIQIIAYVTMMIDHLAVSLSISWWNIYASRTSYVIYEVMRGIGRYPSQAAIIASLVEQRRGRLLKDGRFIELYRRFDPRPKLDFAPYKRLIEGI